MITHANIMVFLSQFHVEIAEARTPPLRRELITKVCQQARHDGIPEDEISEIRVRLLLELRRAHYRGTPGRKQPPQADKATQAIFNRERGGR